MHQVHSNAVPAPAATVNGAGCPPRAGFTAGCGARLYDVSGQSWVDCDLGGGALILGHAAAAVQAALEATLAAGWSVAGTRNGEALGALIATAVPHHDEVRLFPAGWQATGFAIAQACLSTGRRAVGRFCHRPDQAGTIAYPRIANGWTITERMLRYGDQVELDDLAAGHLALAAVIVDGADFIRDPSAFETWLSRLSSACVLQGTQIVVDETVTGFRLAYGGVQEHLQFEADSAIFGSVVGGGIPLAAVSRRRGARTGGADVIPHGFEADAGFDPFALAAGAATLRVLSEHRDAVYGELFAAGRQLRDLLNGELAARGHAPVVTAVGATLSTHALLADWLGPAAGISAWGSALSHLRTLSQRHGVVIGATDLMHLSTAHTAQDLSDITPKLCEALGDLRTMLA